jgi:hypothetical protein
MRQIVPTSVVVAVALAGVCPTRGRAADKDPAAHKNSSHPDNAKKKAEKKAAETTVSGQVVRVIPQGDSEGVVWVKQANSNLLPYHVHGSTKLNGVRALGALTKGSMVTVVAAKSKAVSVTVSQLAPPPPPDKVAGRAVSGKVVKVSFDKYGDNGSLTVRPAAGAAQAFQVTNATLVSHPNHPDVIHSLQFVKDGDSVTVEHDGGKIALFVAVSATK